VAVVDYPAPVAGPLMIYVAGTGSFAADVAEVAQDAGFEVGGLIELRDPDRVGTEIHGFAVIALGPSPHPDAVAIVGAGGDRASISDQLEQAGWRFATVIHPRAHVPRSAQLGAGTLAGPGAILGAGVRTGRHVVLGRGCTVGHHTALGDFVTINPGADVAGNAELGDGTFVGIGAVVRDHVRIGQRAVVAAGAVVVADVDAGAEVRGVPARPVERAAP
jgi:sugar O-acyltransferase (sialic acid O-acetyltransferase NeuD family)